MGWLASAWRRLGCLAALLTALLSVLVLPLVAPVRADITRESAVYRCDDILITASVHAGAVDDPTIPNRSGDTLPGAFVVLQGPDLSLQLPRTNNAGPPSFTDGKWWWSLENPDHPTFLMRRGSGDSLSQACDRMDQTSLP